MLKKLFSNWLHILIASYKEPLSPEKVEKIERRLQMLLVFILFTPTILVSLGSDALQQNNTVRTWGAIVSIYVLIYILIEASNGKMSRLKGAVINTGVWMNICAFVPFFFLIALYQDVISGMPLIIFFVTLITVFWSPLILLSILILEFAVKISSTKK